MGEQSKYRNLNKMHHASSTVSYFTKFNSNCYIGRFHCCYCFSLKTIDTYVKDIQNDIQASS